MELDLICPRPLRLICTRFSAATHVLSQEKKCITQSGCYGMLFFNNLVSQWRKTVFIWCMTLWKHEVIHSRTEHSFIHSHLLFVTGVLFFLDWYLSFHITGKQVPVMSLLLLVSYCIHYSAEYLHLWCIPTVQRELCSRNLIQSPDRMESVYDSTSSSCE